MKRKTFAGYTETGKRRGYAGRGKSMGMSGGLAGLVEIEQGYLFIEAKAIEKR